MRRSDLIVPYPKFLTRVGRKFVRDAIAYSKSISSHHRKRMGRSVGKIAHLNADLATNDHPEPVVLDSHQESLNR